MSVDPSELFPEIANLYEFPSVHADMVFDMHRVGAYRRAIHQVVKPGSVVADIGTGTGILAFLALQAGAKRVHAIERTGIIECARELAVMNGFDKRIVFHHCDSKDARLNEGVDVIISELIGHMGFEEGIANTLMDARDRLLHPNGVIIPNRLSLYAAPVSASGIMDEVINVWDQIHGIDFSPMRQRALNASYVTTISERDLIGESVSVLSMQMDVAIPQRLSTTKVFKAFRPGNVDGFAVWFAATLTDSVEITSGPWSKTHWKQCFVPLKSPVYVTEDDELHASITITPRSMTSDSFIFQVENVEVHRGIPEEKTRKPDITLAASVG